MAVNGANVLHSEFGEHLGRKDGRLNALFHSSKCVKGTVAHPAERLQGFLAVLHQLVIAMLRTNAAEIFRQSADSWLIAAAVVIDDDNSIAFSIRRNIIERFPAHAASQRAVAHHGYCIAAGFTFNAKGLTQTVDDGNGSRSMRGFSPIMLRLTTVGITGQTVFLPQSVELLCPASQNLMNIRLVRRIEHNGVTRGIKNTVQRDGQFHDAKVRAKVSTRD